MLLAEVHGKRLEDARDNEDYLTSAVFGRLRYVPPGPFRDDLLRRATGLPGEEISLGEVLAKAGHLPSTFSRLKIYFWTAHPKHGEPDLILVFTADGRPPLVVLIEAKLWSEKSGTGDQDQLVRYVRVLQDLGAVKNGEVSALPAYAGGYLVYLTSSESLAELEDSAACLDDPARDKRRLFRLQWQDLLEAADTTWRDSREPAWFFDLESRIDEPFLLLGQLKYRLQEDVSAVTYLNQAWNNSSPWHLWYAYARWSGDQPQPGAVLVGSSLENHVEWFKVMACPFTASAQKRKWRSAWRLCTQRRSAPTTLKDSSQVGKPAAGGAVVGGGVSAVCCMSW